MRRRWISLLPVIGLTAVVLGNASVSAAQVSDARRQMESARKLYSQAVDAISASKFDDAMKHVANLQADVNLITEKQIASGKNVLDDRDKRIWTPKSEELYNKAREIRVVTGVMQSEREIRSTSNLSRLKDGWREFDDAFKRFSEDFDRYMKDFQERAKKLREYCGRDCS